MMNFEERKAEIFRRSDERIKARKRNRQSVLLGCMSLVIFVSVISAVAVYPLMRLQEKSSSNWGEDSIKPIHFFLEIINDQTGYHEIIEDQERAYAVANILVQYTLDDISDKDLQMSPTEDQGTESKNTDFYEIIFGNEEERKTVFILSGNTLTEVDPRHEYQLTDAELEEILNALGIAD